MAELADALGSGPSEGNFIGVQVPFRAKNGGNDKVQPPFFFILMHSFKTNIPHRHFHIKQKKALDFSRASRSLKCRASCVHVGEEGLVVAALLHLLKD